MALVIFLLAIGFRSPSLSVEPVPGLPNNTRGTLSAILAQL